MIRSHFGLERNPFDGEDISLLPHQREIFETIKVHARQGGMCVIMGEPGTGKSVIKHAILDLDRKKFLTPSVARTLHTYANTLKILCNAMGVDEKGRTAKHEKLLIEAAFKANSRGMMLMPVIDDAHLMEIDCLRRVRLLLEDFPKNHNLVLVAQPPLMHSIKLSANEDIRSRITYSVNLSRLNPNDIKNFIFGQLDRIGLPHSIFSDDALDLVIRSSEGVLRKVRNLCVSALLEAVRDRTRVVDLKQVNSVLMQPHWRQERDITEY